MKCPKCGGLMKVSKTIQTDSGKSIIRYRNCPGCGWTKKTVEA